MSRVSDTAQSLPVNLDQVATRLQDVSASNDRWAPRWPSLATTTEIDEEEQHRDDLQYETESYNKLVKDGGRPSSDRRDGRRGLKRSRPEDLDEELHSINVIDDDRPSKRLKNSGRSLSRNSRMVSDLLDLTTSAGELDISNTATTISEARKVKGSYASPNQPSRVFKPPPRRSSRISEREQRLNGTIKTPQLLTLLSSTPPKTPNKKSPARTTKRGRTDSRRHTIKTEV